jgi:MFS family permease
MSRDRPSVRHRIAGATRSLPPNIWLQIGAAVLGGFYKGGFTPVWQPFVFSLGGSVALLGLLESLGGWGGLVTSGMNLLGGWLADRLGRRPVMILGSLFTALAMFFYTMAAVLHLWSLLVPGIVLAGMGLMSRPANSSVTAESVSSERRGVAFSLTMFAFITPGVVSSVIGGQVSERWGYLPVMAACFVLEAAILLLLIRFLRETRHIERTASPLPRAERPRASLGQSLQARFRQLLAALRRLWRFILPLGVDSFCWGLCLSLLFGFLKKSYSFTDGQLGWVNASFSLAWAASQLPVGRLVDRHGCKFFLIISEVVSITCLVMFLLWPTFPGMVISYALFGFSAALWVPALYKWLAGSVTEEERGRTLGAVFTIQALARFPAPLLAAWLYEWKGFTAPLWVGLVLAVGITGLLAWLVQEPPRETEPK